MTGHEKGALTPKQREFVRQFIQCGSAKEAAIAAGVNEKNAATVGATWLNPVKHPGVAVELARLNQLKEMKALRKADEVLQYIHAAMWVNPTDYFMPGGIDGGWLIEPEKLRELPDDVKRLIEEVRIVKREIETDSGMITTTVANVRLVSKGKAMELAARHQLAEKIEITKVNIPWEEIAKPPRITPAQAIEERLLMEAELPIEVVVPRTESASMNGTNGKH